MANVKNLDFTLIVIYVVVNQEWAMNQLPDAWPLVNGAAHARKALE